MLRIIRFVIILMVIFGLMSLFQVAGLDQGTAFMLISLAVVILALIVARTLRTKQTSYNEKE
jgi:uncharacterized membrane protein